MKTTNRLMYASITAAALLLASIAAMSSTMLASGQTNTATIGNATTTMETSTTVANVTDFETARQQYLEAWNQTEFHALFDTFVEPYSDQGYGAYTEHPSDVFRPGDTIALYLEPVGF